MINHARLDYIPLKVNSNMVQHPGEKGPAHLTQKLQTHLRKNTSSSNSSAIMYVSFISGFTSLYATVGQQASHLNGRSEVLYNCSCKGCQEFFFDFITLHLVGSSAYSAICLTEPYVQLVPVG